MSDLAVQPSLHFKNAAFFKVSFTQWVALIFVCAVLLRLGVAYQIAGSPLFDVLVGDARHFTEWAKRISAGDWFGSEVFFQTPAYPYFLGLIFAGFGDSLWWPRLFQALLGGASCVCLMIAGKRCFGHVAGVAAGIGAAIYAPFVFGDVLLHKPALQTFFLASILCVVAKIDLRTQSAFATVALGVLIALGALVQEHLLLFIPAMLLWILLAPASFKTRSLFAGALVLGAALIFVPVGLRNQAIGGTFLITTSNAGVNFWIGNGTQATGSYVELVPGHGDPRYERSDARQLAQQARGRVLSDAEVTNYWFLRASSFIAENPKKWIDLLVTKLGMVANDREIPDTDALPIYRDESSILDVLAMGFRFGVLLPLALYGALAYRDQWKRHWLLLAIPLGLVIGVVTFFVLGRYRLLLVPFMLLWAGAGVSTLIRQKLDFRMLVIALSLSICAWLPTKLNSQNDRAIGYYSLGLELGEHRRFDEAFAYLKQARRYAPERAEPLFAMAQTANLRKDYLSALGFLKEARLLAPEHPIGRAMFANTLQKQAFSFAERGAVGEAKGVVTRLWLESVSSYSPVAFSRTFLLMAEFESLCGRARDRARAYVEEAMKLGALRNDRAVSSALLASIANAEAQGVQASKFADVALAAAERDPYAMEVILSRSAPVSGVNWCAEVVAAR